MGNSRDFRIWFLSWVRNSFQMDWGRGKLVWSGESYCAFFSVLKERNEEMKQKKPKQNKKCCGTKY